MKRLLGMFAACWLVCACSSISKKQNAEVFPWPPTAANGSPLQADNAGPVANTPADRLARDHDLENKLRDDPSQAMKFLVRYRQARLWSEIDPAKSCALWLEVAKTPRFPLAQLARIRAVENCPAGRTELADFGDLPSATQAPWLREASLRAALHLAELKGDSARDQQIDDSLDLAPFLHTQSEQVKLISHALKLARDTGDEKRIEKAQAQLEHIAARFIVDPKPDQYMVVAADYRRAREFDRARQFYKREFERDSANDFDRLHALDGTRMSYKLEGSREKYLLATRDYAEFAKTRFQATQKRRRNPSQNYLRKYVETRIVLARAEWTENSASEAARVLLQLEFDLRRTPQIEESMFIRARIEEEAGHLDKTVQILSDIKLDKITDHAFRQKLLWYRGWNLRKVGRNKEATEVFAQLLLEEDSTSSISRDHFWLARTLNELGDHEHANTELAWLTANDPLGYYGMLAYHELNQPIPPLVASPMPVVPMAGALGEEIRTPASITSATPPPSLAPSAPDAGQALFPEERLTFEWLVATGETDLAKRFLDQIDTARHTKFTDEQMLDELQLYARAGAFQSLFARLNDLTPQARSRVVQAHPELIFPRPWTDLIATAATRNAVEKELVFSIMRQESSFNPMSRSGADAFGLMQLIPEMAREASSATGIPLNSNEELYQPEINIPLGVEFLKSELDKWEGQFIPAVASYNAGFKAVHGWMKTRDRKDPLQFIEDIPYDETRGYVKLVLRNFIFYSRLNSVTHSLPFPDRCLNGLQGVRL